MTGEERRQAIVAQLGQASAPVSATALGKQLGVSRQVIVQDIALLRTAGRAIQATNRGYVLAAAPSVQPRRLVKVRHTREQIEDELNIVVDLGACVEDVMVNHRTYGLMSASLGVGSRRDVQRFLGELETGISSPLCTLTDGYHFHHVSAQSEAVLDEVEAALEAAGYSAPLTDYERAEL